MTDTTDIECIAASFSECPDDDAYYDDECADCWNCGGEGFVYGCSWDWQCDTWDGDSCLCTRPCEFCHPPKRDPALSQVLSDGLQSHLQERQS